MQSNSYGGGGGKTKDTQAKDKMPKKRRIKDVRMKGKQKK
jgi:hypothetical protein